MTNLKEIEKVAANLNYDSDEISKELKRVQSIKCRLKTQKGKASYEKDMNEVLKYEQVLKEARNLVEPKKKPVTEFTKEDVEKLDYDETIKAILSIQSKKTRTKWLTTEEGNNEEYKKACQIEKLLIDRREQIKPVDDEHVRKTDVKTILETIESSGNLSQDQIKELLKKLI